MLMTDFFYGKRKKKKKQTKQNKVLSRTSLNCYDEGFLSGGDSFYNRLHKVD